MYKLGLVLVFTLVHVCAFADRTATDEGRMPKRPAHTNEELMESARLGLLDLFLRRYRAEVHQGSDLEKLLSSKLSATQKADDKAFLAQLGEMPAVDRFDHRLIVKFKSGVVEIEWPHMANNDVIVGGVPFLYDEKNSLKENYQNFERRAARFGKQKEAAAWLSFMPDADAGVVGTVTRKMVGGICSAFAGCKVLIGLVAGGVLAKGVDDGYNTAQAIKCWVISPAKPWESWGMCGTWKTEHDAWVEKSANATLANTMPAGMKMDWSVKGDQVCPQSDAAGLTTYETMMRQVEIKKGSKARQIGDWFYFKGKAKNGQLISGAIYSRPEDSKDDDDSSDTSKAETILNLQGGPNKALRLISIRARNYDMTEGQNKTPYKTINLSDANLPGYRDTLAKMQMLAESAETWFEACDRISRNAELNKYDTKESVQSMMTQPAPAVVPTSATSSAVK